MAKTNIHPTAIVEPEAKIGSNVTIEAYAVVKGTVTLEDNVTIKSYVYLDGHTTIGAGTTIYPGASIGTKTQDLKFRGEKTFVVIGKNCEIREYVTINSSCQENSVVRVGDQCLIMAYCHVAHNCEVGNRVIMANGVNLAGHVVIEDCAVIGGMAAVHQFTRIGCYAMVGGFSRVTHDVPPYSIGGGVPYKLGGLNLVGLKRHGFPITVRKDLTRAFKLTYRSGLRLKEALEQIQREVEPSLYIKHWLQFCRASRRGLIGLHGCNRSPDALEELEEYEEMLQEEMT
ncbi:MAG: acyl-ACP--UDP-N-acetylglucosamine O-acyltransferase [Verrucomicrobia bacterium]|nr:acyl-ACP--UDP-N-acetylglucosamine O-acyltransferase [Verrucomicrobiota bacterium]